MTVPLGDASAATVEIVHAGQVITRVAATTKLLHDAVASIPDAGFREHPAQRRKELFKKIDALDKKLAKKDFSEAREILHDEIREDLLEDLINGYPTQSPLELSKDQILSLVDDLVQRLPQEQERGKK
jgi:Ca2+-binding EF-hand superfamily protein